MTHESSRSCLCTFAAACLPGPRRGRWRHGPAVDRSSPDRYRNLDDDRPTLIEDAYPAEHYAFELLAPGALLRLAGPGGIHFVPELEYGLLNNLHFGLKLPIAHAETAGGNDWGLAGLSGSCALQFQHREPLASLRWPCAPTSRSRWEALRAKAPASRPKRSRLVPMGRTRVHLNGAYTFDSEAQLAAAEPAHKWWLGGAVDRTLFRQSALLIVELYALRPSLRHRSS